MAVKYKKATAPLDETARERLWASAPLLHGEETSELADLVDSFYEGRGDGRVDEFGSGVGDCREMLNAVLLESGADMVAEGIRIEVEGVMTGIGSGGDEVKRRVMGRLRDKGHDAGLCKSQWIQTGQTSHFPSGNHEYIDEVADNGARYIIEINLAGEFEIARPTDEYTALLRSIPKVFVAKPEVLRSLIDAMCVAAKESIKIAGMHVPPWRTREYMRKKWFGPYKRRTTNSKKSVGDLSKGHVAVTGGAAVSAGISNRKFCRLEIAGSWEGARDRELAAGTPYMNI